MSVIVIFLDAEPFLAEAIESVLAQTYRDWELLLVDDGSTDASAAIARSFVDRNPNAIRLLAHPGGINRGMSASRNLGIRESTGEFVALLDADDAWFPTTLEEQVDALDRHEEAAMVYGPLTWWSSWSDAPASEAPVIGYRSADHVEELGVPADAVIPPPRLLPRFLRDEAAVPSGMLVRRTAIEAVGGFEESFRGEYEDQVFCAKVCLAFPVLTSSRTWYRYRQHPDSAVAVGLRTGATRGARIAFLRWLVYHLRRRGEGDAEVWRAVRYELRRALHPRRHRALLRMRHVTERVSALARPGVGARV